MLSVYWNGPPCLHYFMLTVSVTNSFGWVWENDPLKCYRKKNNNNNNESPFWPFSTTKRYHHQNCVLRMLLILILFREERISKHCTTRQFLLESLWNSGLPQGSLRQLCEGGRRGVLYGTCIARRGKGAGVLGSTLGHHQQLVKPPQGSSEASCHRFPRRAERIFLRLLIPFPAQK